MSQENSRFASTLNVNGTTYAYYPVSAVAGSGAAAVLADGAAGERAAQRRNAGGGRGAGRAHRGSRARGVVGSEIEFSPARVLFQDFTGVPVFGGLRRRDARGLRSAGRRPDEDQPADSPGDLVIDHSVIADVAGCAGALAQNMELEFSRNKGATTFEVVAGIVRERAHRAPERASATS